MILLLINREYIFFISDLSNYNNNELLVINLRNFHITETMILFWKLEYQEKSRNLNNNIIKLQ